MSVARGRTRGSGRARLAAVVGITVWTVTAGFGLVLPSTASADPTASTPVTATAAGGTVSTYLVDTASAKASKRAATTVERAGGRVTQRYTKVLKGFAATMTADQAKKLRAARGVLTVAQDKKIIAAPCLDCPPDPETREQVANWGLLRLSSREKVTLEPQQPEGPVYVHDSDGEGVTAFVLDSGIDPGQAELGGRVLPGHDFVAGGTGGPVASDCSGHGTRVAEIVGGDRTGVADQVQLVPLRVFDCGNEGTWSGVVAALDWAVVHRPDGPAVVNISGAGHAFGLGDKAVRATVRAGLPVVVSAGNVHDDACDYSPARAGAALTVAASTIEDRRAPSSDAGRCVDLFAAGQDVVTTSGTVSGTSFAAAHVTGAVARYLENHRRATPAEVTRYLEDHATKGALSDTRGAPNRLLYLPAPVAPGAPRDVAATVDDAANLVTATWRRPAKAGSAPITSYQVCLLDKDVLTNSPGGQCLSVPASARTATLGRASDGFFLEDGDVYTLRVAAVGKAGSGFAETEVRLAPALPSAPGLATQIDQEAGGILLFVQPGDQAPEVGAITGYRFTRTNQDGSDPVSVTIDTTNQFYEFTDIVRGRPYVFTAALVTADGVGASSAPVTVTYPA